MLSALALLKNRSSDQRQGPAPSQQEPQGYYPPQQGYAPPPYSEYQDPNYQPHPPPQYQQAGENASYYQAAPPQNQQGYPPMNGEDRGLGSTVVGGATGAYLGHQAGGGLATAGGAVLGAVGMNMATHALQNQNQPQYQQPYPQNPGYYAPGSTTVTTTTYNNGYGNGYPSGYVGGPGLLGGGLIGARYGGGYPLGPGGRVAMHRDFRRRRLGYY